MTEAGTVAMKGFGGRGAPRRGMAWRPAGPAPPATAGASAAPEPAPDAAGRDDAELVARARRGDGDAFGALAGRYFGTVYAIAYARLRQREAAEDLAQETMLRAYLSLGTLSDPTRFAAWTARQARNLAIDWLRRGATRSRLLTMVPLPDADGADGAGGGEPVSSGAAGAAGWWSSTAAALPPGDPRRTLVERQERDALDRALAAIPLDQRELLLLRHAEDIPANEIARRLGLHPSTVGRQLERAAESVRRALADDTGFPSAPAARVTPPATPTGVPRTPFPFAARPAARARAVAMLAAAAALAAPSRDALASAVLSGNGAAATGASLPSVSASAAPAAALAAAAPAASPTFVLKGITLMGFVKIATIAAGVVTGIATTWIAIRGHTSGMASEPFGLPVPPSVRDTVVQKGWDEPADILLSPGERYIFKWPAGNRAGIAQSSVYLTEGRELNGNYQSFDRQSGGSFLYDLKQKPVNFVNGTGPEGTLVHLTAENEGEKVRVKVTLGHDPELPAKAGAVENDFRSGKITNATQRRRLSDLFKASAAAPSDPERRALFDKAVDSTVQERTAPPNLPLPNGPNVDVPARLRRDP